MTIDVDRGRKQRWVRARAGVAGRMSEDVCSGRSVLSRFA
jgi:hypothetical protein